MKTTRLRSSNIIPCFCQRSAKLDTSAGQPLQEYTHETYFTSRCIEYATSSIGMPNSFLFSPQPPNAVSQPQISYITFAAIHLGVRGNSYQEPGLMCAQMASCFTTFPCPNAAFRPSATQPIDWPTVVIRKTCLKVSRKYWTMVRNATGKRGELSFNISNTHSAITRNTTTIRTIPIVLVIAIETDSHIFNSTIINIHLSVRSSTI